MKAYLQATNLKFWVLKAMNKKILTTALLLVGTLAAGAVQKQPPDKTTTKKQMNERAIVIEGGAIFSHFQQQGKQEIGGTSGTKLIENTLWGFSFAGSYRLHEYFSAGAFLRFDYGFQSSGQFTGSFNTDGSPVVTSQGGHFSEFWLGPLLRLHYKMLFLEIGHGSLALRNDRARIDLPTNSGASDGYFATTPSIS